MKIRLNENGWRLTGCLGDALMRGIFFGVRFTEIDRHHVEDSLSRGAAVGAVWHGRCLPLAFRFREYGAAAMVSRHTDGEIMARILRRQGNLSVRGSTSRGGRKALGEMVRLVKAGHPAVLTPDGPQGPRFKAQSGVIALSRKTGVPIVPAGVSADRACVFSSWDRFQLPLPLSRCVILYGEPIHASPDPADHEFDRRRLEFHLNRLTRMADRMTGQDPKNGPGPPEEPDFGAAF